MKINAAYDGREALVYLLKFGETAVTTPAPYTLYAISGKAATGSVFGELEVGHLYFTGATAPTLASDDTLVSVDPKFIGGATDKSLEESKETQEVTCDKDRSRNVTSNGIVNRSGSVSAYDLIYDVTDEVHIAQNEIKSRFSPFVQFGADGVEVLEATTTSKDCLIFVWGLRSAGIGEYVPFDVVPCFITSISRNAAYNSPQAFDMNFDGADTDDYGHKAMKGQFTYGRKDMFFF